MHQLGLRVLNDILNCSLSLVFTYLYVTNQAKALTLEGTLDLHKTLAGWKGTKSNKLEKAKNFYFFLLRILLKGKVPKFSHLKQIETNVHEKEKSLVF